jgi:hypothetical protein
MNINMKEYLRKFKKFEDISGMFRNIVVNMEEFRDS